MRYGVAYRSPGGRFAGLLVPWTVDHGVLWLRDSAAEARSLMDRIPWLKDYDARVMAERMLLHYLEEVVEVFSGYREIQVVNGHPKTVVVNPLCCSFEMLRPKLEARANPPPFQRLVGSKDRSIVRSLVVRVRKNRDLPRA